MSSHHDHDQPVNETKPVAFRTPLIMALVTVFAILLLVSTCDKKEECCCEGEKCETKCEDKHGEHHGTEATEEHHEAASVVTETITLADSVATTHDTAKVHIEHVEAHH
jgi:hypothetical protein